MWTSDALGPVPPLPWLTPSACEAPGTHNDVPHRRDEGRPGIFSGLAGVREATLGYGASGGGRGCLATQPPPWGQQEACGSVCLRPGSPIQPLTPPQGASWEEADPVLVCVCSMHVCACCMNQAGECVGGHGMGRRGSVPG